MITSKLSALALAVAVVAVASPALAATKHAHRGYTARAQAIDPSMSEEMTPHRADALRECNAQANKLVQKDWGVRQTTMLGACMMEHGETE
jgi:hypothetical protein